MGNLSSCFCNLTLHPSLKTAKLTDLHGNLRHVNLPIIVAELMLERPGYFISPAEDLRRTLRFSAMKADEELQLGMLYVSVPTARLRSKASASEVAVLDSGFRNRGSKRPSSKVLPTEKEGEGEESCEEFKDCRLGNKWRPCLEPIYEGI